MVQQIYNNYVTAWITTHHIDPAILFVSQKAPRKYA